ncbi:MAG: alanine racemase [Hyphomicrobiaceae bacterium]|nr:alanine racemase [Hyphomicrobiaceae bacterium]
MTTLADLETPSLVLDRTRLERNLAAMRERCRGLGVSLRTHVKTPKSVEIGRRAHGGQAGPIAVSTLREAEHFAQNGFRDILCAVAIAPAKLRRVAAIQKATRSTVRVVLDSEVVARAIADFAGAEAGGCIEALIEIDCGEHRSGIAPDDPALLAIARHLDAPGVQLAGVMTHGGHSYASADAARVREVAAIERDSATTAARRLREAGHAAPIVSVGSSPTILHAEHLDGVTEARCGVYTLWDLAQASRGMCRLDDIAASVLATVIGHNRAGQSLILDAGALALSKDISANTFMPEAGYGLVCDAVTCTPLAPLAVSVVHQEHGSVRVPDETWYARLPIGTQVRILPNHTCMTCAAYESYHVLENDRVVDTWGRVNGW